MNWKKTHIAGCHRQCCLFLMKLLLVTLKNFRSAKMWPRNIWQDGDVEILVFRTGILISLEEWGYFTPVLSQAKVDVLVVHLRGRNWIPSNNLGTFWGQFENRFRGYVNLFIMNICITLSQEFTAYVCSLIHHRSRFLWTLRVKPAVLSPVLYCLLFSWWFFFVSFLWFLALSGLEGILYFIFCCFKLSQGQFVQYHNLTGVKLHVKCIV